MKKFIAVLIILPVLGITGCNSQNNNNTEIITETAHSEMWEYEYYIEDLDYYISKYADAVAKFSELTALQDWSGAKAEAESHIEILDDIAAIVTPAGLAEYQNDILTAVEYEKEYRRIADELFSCVLSGSEQSEIDKLAVELQEFAVEDISINNALTAARAAALAYLQ